MEVTDIAQKLWARYSLPWQNDAHLASEWYAKTFVRGVINPHRRLEYIGEQGTNRVTSLRYVERGYGENGGFGGVVLNYSPLAAMPAVSYEVNPAAYKEFANRLGRSGMIGKTLQVRKPLSLQSILVAEHVAVSLDIIEPFFVSFIDALPVNDKKQQGK